MIISIDFDDTWTRDPDAWRTFARLLHGRGHTVLVTTNRYAIPLATGEVYRVVGTRSVKEVIFAGAKPKRQAAREKGYDVDVWVDDSPEMVFWGRHHPNPSWCECRAWPRARRSRGGHHRLCPLYKAGMVG